MTHAQSTSGNVALTIDARARDIDGLGVRRVLPFHRRRMVGPFIFFDHIGPSVVPPGEGMQVRPHPHINLATVTYLFEGSIMHRDSLGTAQRIEPGAINWMTAGRGITHSERSPALTEPVRMHGIQLWVALPDEHQETDPAFAHHPADTLPQREEDGVKIRVLAGSGFGLTSPVETFSPMLYAEAHVMAGRSLTYPAALGERAAYVIDGRVRVGGEVFGPAQMLVLEEGEDVTLHADADADIMLLAGEPVGHRHIWWNFVSSDKARIEEAKRDWKDGKFPTVPGDDTEFIPLPDK